MLTTNQIADLEAALQDVNNKKLILDTAMDIQALLRLLVEKEIISRDEISKQRKEVRESPKWNAACMYIEQTLQEIDTFQKNPELQLKAMWKRKMEGK